MTSMLCTYICRVADIIARCAYICSGSSSKRPITLSARGIVFQFDRRVFVKDDNYVYLCILYINITFLDIFVNTYFQRYDQV